MVCIVILNWNGWSDSIECLESVFRMDFRDFQVVLCDNDSKDRSLDHIKAWADGELSCVPGGGVLREPTYPVPKPIRYSEYRRKDIECLADATNEKAPLVLIQTGENRGFAGGNNIGLCYAMKRRDMEFVWLLNNDTVVCRDALKSMVGQMRLNPSAGICGSKIMSYHEPDKVQTLGGRSFNKWLGIPGPIGAGTAASLPVDQAGVLRRMAYVTGASMFVSRAFLNDVGLMDERYFLYYEEIDWVIRAKNRYSLEFTPESVVYHKEGASTGTTSSYCADFYNIRSRIRFTRKHFPYALPTVYLGVAAALWNRIRRNQWDRVALILRTAFGSDRCRPTSSGRRSCQAAVHGRDGRDYFRGRQ